MRRYKLFTGLNIFGLATGLACTILIFAWVQDEWSYDRFNPGAEKIFRVTGTVKDIPTVEVPTAFSAAIRNQVLLAKNATRIYRVQKIITLGTRKFDEKRIFCADSNFLSIFKYPLLRGSKTQVLLAPNSILLTKATAIKYFGGVDQAMGKQLFDENDSLTLQVTGILEDVPANSHLQFDLLLPVAIWDRHMDLTQTWRYFDSYTYLQLADAVLPDAATIHSVERQLNAIRNRAIVATPSVPAVLSVQPLTDIHLFSHYNGDVDGQGNIQYVRIFTLVAVFIVFIACINFMNLATALSGARAKEVGLRKTVGAGRLQLTLQYIGESLLLSLLSLVLALLLVCLALPFFNSLSGKSITLNLLDIAFIGKALGITMVVGLLAGSYPAFYISSFNAIRALKGGEVGNSKGAFLRNGLVVLQFSISVLLMVSTVVIYQQLNYIHNRDIGFDKDRLLYIRMPQVVDRDRNADALKTELRRSLAIAGLTITWDIPTNLGASSPLTWRGMEKGRLVIATRLGVDENYVATMGMKMAAGRFYSSVYRENDSEYVVNETAVRVMGIEPAAAIGRMITINGQEGAIIGVVKDFNFKPVYQPIEPLVLKHRASGAYFVIRPAVGGLQQALATVGNIFHRIYGNAPFSYGFVDQDLDHLYKAESRMGSLFTIFSALSIAISCLGLFGLAAFATQRRKKEIGVRKILGAGEAGIVVLLAREFLRLVAISLLIAFPIAWYAMHRWLDGFVYKTGISGWIFVATGGLALLIAFMTVSYQTIRAATANPVNSLKRE